MILSMIECDQGFEILDFSLFTVRQSEILLYPVPGAKPGVEPGVKPGVTVRLKTMPANV
jgi:hypothetical protein